MENILNEFNGDLVYTLIDDDNTVVKEVSMPSTNSGKTYLMTSIPIGAGVLKKYKMIVTYKYTDEDQSAYQGAAFKATLGIDTEKTLAINSKANYSIYSWDQNIMSDYYMNDKIKEKISEIETILDSSGRVLVRPSGTEPLIRVMLEGKDLKVINKYAMTLADLIEEELN